MTMSDFEKAAETIVDEYSGRLGSDEGSMQLYFDPEGNELPFRQVADGSPGGMQGELEYYDPTPGHGSYAILFLEVEGASRDGTKNHTYLISGPDWKINVEVKENRFLGERFV